MVYLCFILINIISVVYSSKPGRHSSSQQFSREQNWYKSFLEIIPALYNNATDAERDPMVQQTDSPLFKEGKLLERDIVDTEELLYCQMYQSFGVTQNYETFSVLSVKNEGYLKKHSKLIETSKLLFLLNISFDTLPYSSSEHVAMYNNYEMKKNDVTIVLIKSRKTILTRSLKDLAHVIHKMSRYIASIILDTLFIGAKIKNLDVVGVGFGGHLGLLAIKSLQEMIPGLRYWPQQLIAIDPIIHNKVELPYNNYYSSSLQQFTLEPSVNATKTVVLFTKLQNTTVNYFSSGCFLEIYVSACKDYDPLFCFLILNESFVKVEKITDNAEVATSSIDCIPRIFIPFVCGNPHDEKEYLHMTKVLACYFGRHKVDCLKSIKLKLLDLVTTGKIQH